MVRWRRALLTGTMILNAESVRSYSASAVWNMKLPSMEKMDSRHTSVLAVKKRLFGMTTFQEVKNHKWVVLSQEAQLDIYQC